MKILFVGTGLIGGSFSLAMKSHGLIEQSGGYSRKEGNLDRSVELGIIDKKFLDLKEGIRWADWIILSVPVDVIVDLLPGILDNIRPDQLAVDFGSTKGRICAVVKDHPNRSRFIAAHPIAGTEYSGPDAAFTTLFEGKTMIICDQELSDPTSLQEFTGVCKKLGIHIEMMASGNHDRHLAYISHLSHVTSFALSNTVLEKEKDGDIILDLAGSGFASTVRLAKSSPEMWAPIFMDNKKELTVAINNYLTEIGKFKDLLETNDYDGLMNLLRRGREIRKIIK